MGAWSEYKKQQEQQRQTGKWTEYKQSGSYRKSAVAAAPATPAQVQPTRPAQQSPTLSRYKAQGGVTFEQYKAAEEQARAAMARGGFTGSSRGGFGKTEGAQAVRRAAERSGKVSEQEFNRSTAMQQQYGSYQNYLRGVYAGYDEAMEKTRQQKAQAQQAAGKVTEGEFNRSTAMQQKYGTYQNYLNGTEVTTDRQTRYQAQDARLDNLGIREDVARYFELDADADREEKDALRQRFDEMGVTGKDFSDFRALLKNPKLAGDYVGFGEAAADAFISGSSASWLGGQEATHAVAEAGINKAAAWALRDLAKSKVLGGIFGQGYRDSLNQLADNLATDIDWSGAQAWQDEYSRIMERATKDRSDVGKFVVENLPSVGSMLLDAGLAGMSGVNPIKETTNLSTLTSMASRAGGNAALDAKNAGATDGEAIVIGLENAAVEVFSEKLFGGNPVYDEDVGLINRAAAKLKNKTLMRVLDSKAFGLASEGLEEVVAELLEPTFQSLVLDGTLEGSVTAEDLGMSFLGGVFVGALGDAAGMVSGLSQARQDRYMKQYAKILIQETDGSTNADVQAARDALRDKLDYGRAPDMQDFGRVIDALDRAGEGEAAERTVEQVRQDAENAVPDNMEVVDENDNGIPDNMEVIDEDGMPENMVLEEDGPSQSAARTAPPEGEPRGEQDAAGAAQSGEPEVRTLLRKATRDDVRRPQKGEHVIGKNNMVGDLLQEYKGRIAEYDQRRENLENQEKLLARYEQTGDTQEAMKSRNRIQLLQEQIARDEAYLEAREKTMQNVADVTRARLENEQQQKELGTPIVTDQQMQALEQSAKEKEAAAESRAQKAAQAQDTAALGTIAKQREYGFTMTSYFIEGYFDANKRVQMDIPAYDEAVRIAYGQGQYGWKFKKVDSQNGIADAVLQEAYNEGRQKGEENGTAGTQDGGKRDAGMDPREPSGSVGEGAGTAAEGSAGGFGIKESIGIANRLQNAGAEQVSSKADGIQNGTDTKAFRRVPDAMVQEYGALRQAKQILSDAGADDVHFVSGSLKVKTATGREISAQGVAQDGTVWISLSAKDGVLKTAEHEAMHVRLESETGLRDRLISALGLSAEERDRLALKYCEAYEGCYTGEDLDAYLDEIVCDAYAGINRAGLGADKLQNAVRAEADRAASQSAKKPAQTRGPPETYSVDAGYAEKLKEWAGDGMPSDASFTLGTTGDVLQGLGAIESDIYMDGGKIRTILAEHPEMTLREIERIPEILDDPVMILKSRNVGRGNQQNSRLVIFGSLKAQNGKPVLSVLDLRPNENGFILSDMQKVTSAYTKDTNPEQFVQSSEVLFTDKKRTPPLLRSLGFYMPSELQQSGSIGSISYKGRSVNMQGEKFSDVVKLDDSGKPTAKLSPETQERAPELTDADAPVLSEEEQQREAWRQMTREVDAEGERLREMEQRGKQYMKKFRDQAVRDLAGPMSAAGTELERKVKPEIDSLIDTYLRTGRLRTKKIEHAFERIYSEAKRMNREFAERYAPVQEKIRQTAITLTEEQKANLTNAVANEQEVRAKALKDLYIVPSGGVEVGELYSQMRAAAPELFPAQKTEAWQQIMQLSTVSRRIAKAEILTAETRSSNPQYFKDNAWETFKAKVLELKPKMRDARDYAQAYDREQTAAREEMLRREEETAREDERRREEEAAAEQEAFQPYDYDKLPGKARQYVDAAVNSAVQQAANAMSIPGKAKRDVLRPAMQEMMREFLKTGTITQETIDQSFADAYDAGIEEDREFYDTYKFVKDKLRTTGVKVTPEVRAEFADLKQFQRAVQGKILLNNEGIGIDTLYAELHDEAPGLFPEAIMNPADQLMRMAEVADKIQITKQTLDEAHRGDGGDFKRWAKNDFEAALEDMKASLRTAQAWAAARERVEVTREAPKTQAEVQELYKRQKEAKRVYERAQRKNLLTDADERILDRLLRGELAPEDIRDNPNAKSILNMYEAKADYAVLTAQIARWRSGVKEGYRAEVRPLLENTEQARDKTGIAPGARYMRETMERNIEDVFPAADAAKINAAIFTPVHEQQAKSTKYKNEVRDRVRQLDLSRKIEKGNTVSEAHAVQLYGEATDNIRQLANKPMDAKRDGKTLAEWEAVIRELWASSPNLDRAKIENAVSEFRKIYDELFEKMNDVRVRNGYAPIDYRKGYFPHFQPGQTDGVLAVMGKALGIKADVTALPTSINGLTHTFKPGITWFGNAQERLGFNTAYDAVEGFDKYIEGAADIIFQTDNIQRLRAFTQELRYRTTDEGVRERVDAIRADENLSEQDKELRIKDLYENAKFELSGLAVELDEYTNLLANKKSRLDRGVESVMGRGVYNVMNWLESRAAANMVAMNPGSWITNFIPLTQAWGYVPTTDMVRAMGQTIAAMKNDDGFWERSAFLTNRRGSDPLVRSWQDSLSAKLSSPMEWIDTFTADTIVRARYEQNIRRGMLEEDAMREADRFAANIMADRSKGATPTFFQSKNPAIKLFTQFQLEVNNQFSNIFKDLPREMRNRGLRALAVGLFKMFFGAWIYNEIYEKIVGRRAALDPIDMTNDLVGDATGYKLNNIFDAATGAEDSVIRKDKPAGLGNTVTNFLTSTAEELPLAGGVLGGGRVPFSSALPDVSTIWKVATNKELDAGTKGAKLWEEVRDPLLYLGLAFGGGQVRKVAQGIMAVAQGGKFYRNNKGELQMQYPVFTDEGVMTGLRTAQATIFGRNSTKEARDWVENDFSKLSTKETNAYLAMSAADVRQREAWQIIQAMKNVDVPEGTSEKDAKLAALNASDASDEAKALYYYNVLASTKEQATIGQMLSENADMGDYLAFRQAQTGVDGWQDTDGKTVSGSKKSELYDLLDSYDFTPEQKDAIAAGNNYKLTGFEPWTEKGKALAEAVRYGKTFTRVLSDLRREGYTNGEISEAITALFRQEYIESDETERERLRRYLANAYERVGKSRKEALQKIDAWVQ